MKAVILAAGRGTRLKPITDTTPKPLIPIRGKPIVEHLMGQLVPYVSEFILIVNYKKEMFSEKFWESYAGIPVTYHTQGAKIWTGWALEWIISDEDVCVFYSDSIFSKQDIDRLCQLEWYGCLVQEVESPEKYGIYSQDKDGNAIEVIEKPSEYIWNLANLWAYKFWSEILQLVKDLQPSPRWEYELTDSINIFCKGHIFKLLPLVWHFLDVSYPDDIQRVESHLQKDALKVLNQRPDFWKSISIDSLKGYTLALGISEKQAHELVTYSLDDSDEALQENTWDRSRFATYDKIVSWYDSPNRYVFTLTDTHGILAGIWWSRKCDFPNVWEILNQDAYDLMKNNTDLLHTNAVRIYPDFRGQRIASPFIDLCSMYYSDLFPRKIICVDVKQDNIPMQKSFDRSGYMQVWYWKNVNSAPETWAKRFIYIHSNIYS